MVVYDKCFAWNAITVRKQYVVTRGPSDRFVEDCAFPESVVLMPDVHDLKVGLISKLVNDFDGPVIRTVVGNDNLEIAVCLTSVTPKYLRQPFWLVVRGQYDRDELWCFHGSSE